MKKLILLFVGVSISSYLLAQNNPITFNPGGSAGGDLFGIKTTESGNNTTKFHIYRNFSFDTQDIDRLVVDAGGKVGIGTSSPTDLIHVKDISGHFKYGRPGTEMNNRLTLDASSGYENQIYFRSSHGRIFTAGNNITIGTSSSANNLAIQASNGNVGIGTSSPDAKFHVYGGNVGNGNVMASIMIGKNNGPEIQTIQQSSDEDVQGLAFRVKSSGTNANPNFEAMRINSNGNVGIGTTTTGTHRLAVEGSIGAREIKVEASGWSDFVFENDYELRTLEEVEEHIAEKGHLPEIPSEAEVTENGINLGEMNAKLLQKIEELTLYLIEQNKQNQAQQARIEKLEQKISQLENE